MKTFDSITMHRKIGCGNIYVIFLELVIPNKDHIVSCSDAIGRMVLEYLKARGLYEEKKETDKEITPTT